jgi:hypothetical protein
MHQVAAALLSIFPGNDVGDGSTPDIAAAKMDAVMQLNGRVPIGFLSWNLAFRRIVRASQVTGPTRQEAAYNRVSERNTLLKRRLTLGLTVPPLAVALVRPTEQ